MQNDELAHLYRSQRRLLERRVRGAVRAPRAVIEDACQFAWCQLVCHREHVRRDAVLGWLSTTATREALKEVRRREREASLEAELELRGDGPVVLAGSPGPHEAVVERERVAQVSLLPIRQQRAVWLKAVGFSQTEMAGYEGCTLRTIDRQLSRARRTLRRQPAELA